MNYQEVIFDTETTGVDCSVDRLVEIAGAHFLGDFTFETLVNPGRDIPAEAKAIHHIVEAEVSDAPDETQAVASFINELFGASDDSPLLIAHNAKFDKGFLDRIAPGISFSYICTYKCSLIAFPDAPKHSNQVLRYYLGLEPKLPEGLYPHRALYDVLVTREIYRELRKLFSIERMIDISSNPVLLPKVPFGKHVGKTWDQVDYGYLKWAVGPTGPKDNEDFIFTAGYWLKKGSGNFGGRR